MPIHDCRKLVTGCGRYSTLRPGDIVLTATPECVIVGYSAPQSGWDCGAL